MVTSVVSLRPARSVAVTFTLKYFLPVGRDLKVQQFPEGNDLAGGPVNAEVHRIGTGQGVEHPIRGVLGLRPVDIGDIGVTRRRLGRQSAVAVILYRSMSTPG